MAPRPPSGTARERREREGAWLRASDLPSLALGKRKPLKGIHGLRFANRRHTPAPTSDGLEGEQSRSQHGASPRRQKAGKEAIDSTESGGHGRRARMKVSQLSKRKSSAEGQKAGVVHSTGSEEGAGVCAGPEAVGSEKHRF